MAARDRLHPSDLDLIPMDVADDGRSGRFTLVPGLVRHDGALYGGTGLAVATMAMQAASGRDVLWATAQFISSPRLGEEIEWTVDVLAEGKRATQMLVRGTFDGAVVFTALGSAGIGADDGLTGQYREMPKASAPETARPWNELNRALTDDSWIKKIDLREADLLEPTRSSALWVRRQDSLPFTPVAVAFAADFVPLGIARAAGKLGAGSSLDNSMRFRPGESTEWVLLELVGEFASGGYGHGSVLAWGQDGSLLGSGSQSAAMRYLYDPGEPSKLPG